MRKIRESINSAATRARVNRDSHKVIKPVDNGNKLGRNFRLRALFVEGEVFL